MSRPNILLIMADQLSARACGAGWDGARVRQRILHSQQRRRWINEAWAAGQAPAWDAQPDFDARQQYVRRYDAAETARRQRLPRVPNPEA
jgi:choline-sulfatase